MSCPRFFGIGGCSLGVLSSRRRLTAVRAARLIDALIDQAHRDWPDAGFVIGLPSGEDVFLPA